MTEEVGGKNKRRCCFLIAAPSSGANTVAKFLAERGIEVTWAHDLPAATAIDSELLRQLAAADFVVAIWTSTPSPNEAFELGVAHALAKPILVLSVGSIERLSLPSIFDLRGINVVPVPELRRLTDIAPDIDRFLRHAKAPPPIVPDAPAGTRSGDLSWARKKLASIRTMKSPLRGFALEDLVSDVFRQAGADVVRTREENDVATERDADLIVWLNDVAYEVGGPILVECKSYGGGSGSVIKNLENTVMRLDKRLVEVSGASLAFVVFDHDRPHTPPSLHETPRVLAFAVETLVDKLEQGTLAKEVLVRRHRASIKSGASNGDA
ncbi:hypothetical protein [Cystobacter fuscus]|uniref:hypothetical protein n=1 Tax=Cystobacter fuscus TaxID=43 RepID=UPI002B2E6717|nr:toll/interleukin-1 receptor domain-containing protein [Cystobacter fuscus]